MAWAPDPTAPAEAASARSDASAGPSAWQRPLGEHAAATTLQVLRWLGVGPRGLTEAEAQRRLERQGENTPARWEAPSAGRRLWSAARSPFVTLLLALAASAAIVGNPVGAGIIAALAGVSCWLRFRQERWADDTLAARSVATATTATVTRRATAGCAPASREVPADQLAVGDVVRLAPGEAVPADLRLLRALDLAVDQAALTGESSPVAKFARPEAAPDTTSATFDRVLDCPWLCFAGSEVVRGTGVGVVVATGAATYARARPGPAGAAETAFDRGVATIAAFLAALTVLCVPATVVVAALTRGGAGQDALLAVSVAVGLTPEMLPVVVTHVLARASAAMASQGVIVRRLPAIHNLGAAQVLCVDKTGTLTRGRLAAAWAVDPTGRPDPMVLGWAVAHSRALAEWADEPSDDPLAEALSRTTLTGEARAWLAARLVTARPASADNPVAVVQLRRPDADGTVSVVTGTVADVLDRCQRIRVGDTRTPLDSAARARARAVAAAQTDRGARLLAVAVADGSSATCGLTLVGFVGCHDAAKPDARAALAALARGGVAVVIVTGDHPGAARALRDEVGLPAGRVLDAGEVDGRTDAEIAALVRHGAVFARTSADQKARVVAAVRERGRVVAYLGDGVNDLPALRAADVGVSVAGSTVAAAQAAEVALGGDLTDVPAAVAAGRRAFAAIAAYLRITLSANLANVVSLLAASVLMPFLPMTPAQLLTQNVCFDLAQLSLAYDRPDDARTGRPRTFQARRLAGWVWRLAGVNVLADLVTFALLWHVFGAHGDAAGQALFRTGWFAENLCTQAICLHLLRRARPPRRGDRAAWPVTLASLGLAAVGLGLPATPLAGPLGMCALPLAYLPCLAAVVVLFAVLTLAVLRAHARPRPRRR